MIKCYVVDDEAHNIRLLSDYIQKTPGLELVGTDENPLDALHAITSGKAAPDIVFVDVDMPELTGVDLAGLINSHTEVIFATAYPDYALQAFEKKALDYLVKPISYERFLQAISRVRPRLHASSKPAENMSISYFFVKSDVKGKLVRIEYQEITYIEALLNYVKIHTTGDTIITYLTLKKAEESLPQEQFSRVHKSFIVNNAKVKTIEGNMILLESGTTVALGSSYRDSFLEKITRHLM